MRMSRLVLLFTLFALTVRAEDPASLAREIEGLKPKKDVWREVKWRTCPLAALAEAKKENKPVLAWVFLGDPSDERC